MKNSKLVEEAKLNPARIYHRPHDVLRDRRLDDAARLQILRAWRQGLGEQRPTDIHIEDISAAMLEIEQRART